MGYGSPLQALRRADEPRFGGKSANLGELLAAGIPVPPGFALSTDALTGFLRESGLEREIAAAMDAACAGDLGSLTTTARAIGEAVRAAPLPEPFSAEVQACYEALGTATGASAPPVAVRSSAVGEDSDEATFAGQQETLLWVREAGPLCDAVRACWASLWSAPALSYRARLPSGLSDAAMGVTVQLMVDAAIAGVMFTCNPVSGDPSVVAINASWGLGLAVVGGEVTPDDYLVSKVTGEVVSEHVHRKAVEYRADPSGDGVVRVDVSPERREAPCLDRDAIASLAELAARVQRHFGSHQDIEWAIGHDGTVFIVQSRPVTGVTKPERRPAAQDALSMVMKTFGASRD